MVVLYSAPALDVYGQMALDEVLSKKEGVCARFFNWTGANAATFGYAQPAASVRRQMSESGILEYTRRLTGGGIVLHRDDLTFSLSFNQPDLSPAVIYNALHESIKAEFYKSGIVLNSYGQASDYRPAAEGLAASCFKNPVSDDLMSAGHKILGGAIRRFGGRVLYQGSLQLEDARNKADYKIILQSAFEVYFNAALSRADATAEDLKAAALLAEAKYKKPLWIDNRRYEENT